MAGGWAELSFIHEITRKKLHIRRIMKLALKKKRCADWRREIAIVFRKKIRKQDKEEN